MNFIANGIIFYLEVPNNGTCIEAIAINFSAIAQISRRYIIVSLRNVIRTYP
ncbi:MAG: hypothetical protein F6K39_35360 [Okeania sp. SIO3B3]|nr:hypothetical protein [Okeania sp. SIO3B3]